MSIPMSITEPFVLKQDVLLIPCAELSEELRGRISFDEGDYTLSRRHGRTFTQVIDGETAALLALFRQPRTIVDAVIENSRSLGKNAEAWLDELLPHIGGFCSAGLGRPAPRRERDPALVRGGDAIAGGHVRCAIHRGDSEI